MAVGNSINDEMREQRRLLKDKPLKEKIEYYVGYYWKTAAVVAFAAIVVINLIYTFATAKEDALCVLFVNTFVKEDLDLDAYGAAFAEQIDLDTKDYQINLQRDIWIDYENMEEVSSANLQKLMVMNAAAAVNVLVVDDTFMDNNAEKGMLGDLSEILPADLLAKYEDRLIYVDAAEDDKGEYPAAIDVSDASIMEYPNLKAYFCCYQTNLQPENTAQFLEYLMAE